MCVCVLYFFVTFTFYVLFLKLLFLKITEMTSRSMLKKIL